MKVYSASLTLTLFFLMRTRSTDQHTLSSNPSHIHSSQPTDIQSTPETTTDTHLTTYPTSAATYTPLTTYTTSAATDTQGTTYASVTTYTTSAATDTPETTYTTSMTDTSEATETNAMTEMAATAETTTMTETETETTADTSSTTQLSATTITAETTATSKLSSSETSITADTTETSSVAETSPMKETSATTVTAETTAVTTSSSAETSPTNETSSSKETSSSAKTSTKETSSTAVTSETTTMTTTSTSAKTSSSKETSATTVTSETTAMTTTSSSADTSSTKETSVTAETTAPVETADTKHGASSGFLTFKHVFIPIFFVVGIVGNTLSVIIMLGKDFRDMTSSLVIIFLSVSDSTVLLMQPFNSTVYIHLLGVDIRSLSEIGCKIFSVLWRTSKMSAAWLVVLISSERFVAVWFPLRIKSISTRRNMKFIIFCIYASAFAFNAGWSFSSKITNDGFCKFNYAGPEVDAYTVHAMLITGTALCGLIPTIMLPLMAIAIACRLYQQRKRRQNIASFHARDETTKSTAMLLSIPIAFIILVSPTWIGHHTSFILGQDYHLTQNALLKTWREIALPLEQLNYSINFLLYVAFSKLYRTRLVALITPRKRTPKTEIPESATYLSYI